VFEDGVKAKFKTKEEYLSYARNLKWDKKVEINDELSPSVMESIEKAAKMLNHAKKPILYVGQGIFYLLSRS
jgi:thiamine pyrophosphate-dependent acetolactate synthase large subunit-like protein